jgi:predicted RNA-binding Zn ribbon-like protein
VAPAEGGLMLDVTWEWIAIYEPALDVANTVARDKSGEHDLLAEDGEYERWAQAAARSPELAREEAAAIPDARVRLLELRQHVRAVLGATAAAEPLPPKATAALNAASAAAPRWPEIDPAGRIEQRVEAPAVESLLASYARSAMEIAAAGSGKLRVCGAPSCGMFYRPRRRQQQWCSEACGNRARFARHYARGA